MNAELLRMSGRGDVDAFMQFYDATCETAYTWASRRYRDRALADEAFRSLYTRAWVASADHADSGISPAAWLISLASPRLSQQTPPTRTSKADHDG